MGRLEVQAEPAFAYLRARAVLWHAKVLWPGPFPLSEARHACVAHLCARESDADARAPSAVHRNPELVARLSRRLQQQQAAQQQAQQRQQSGKPIGQGEEEHAAAEAVAEAARLALLR